MSDAFEPLSRTVEVRLTETEYRRLMEINAAMDSFSRDALRSARPVLQSARPPYSEAELAETMASTIVRNQLDDWHQRWCAGTKAVGA